jgi:signal transduction histidine kinase
MPDSAPGRFGILMGDARGTRYRVYVDALRDSTEYLAVTAPLTHIDTQVAGFARLMWTMAITGGLVAFVIGWIVAQGALRPVTTLTSAAAIIAESREFSHRVPSGSGRDELGHLARTFNTMLANLEAVYDSQARFVSAASHELRAPLTVVQANLDLLRSGKMAESDRPTALAEAHAETSRMTRLVADLLALARADAGVPIRREKVELDRAVLQVIGEARHLARGHRLEIGAVEPVVIRGDPDRLKQLFLNVIENAIKYAPADGRVLVGITRNAGAAVVTISDTGFGISETDLPHVFERFFRADPARSRDPGGSGLGLSIVQWVAGQHGGSVDIASTQGEGTTVTVRLPIADGAT